ncbi:TIGR02449 family protein [Teredinibacter franksiae]|uniref:TIGR02449 family protein n=1 Tax=Teredinibacter franksiae TaxID=2761453 RepID=UPI00162330CA|nr:TIGR02449 family protein [Teredinibacter franksiae]
MTDRLLSEVEARLDDLISLCDRLEQENATLRAKETNWQQERTRLTEKNELARNRVETMINRLKNIEAES